MKWFVEFFAIFAAVLVVAFNASANDLQTNLRHDADHCTKITFHINTDIGFVDNSIDLVPTLEVALADLVNAEIN